MKRIIFGEILFSLTLIFVFSAIGISTWIFASHSMEEDNRIAVWKYIDAHPVVVEDLETESEPEKLDILIISGLEKPEEPAVEAPKAASKSFKLTAYCSCEKCCGQYALNRPDGIVYTASGNEAVAGRTVAVDPNVIPLGSTVVINGKEYIAHDTGAFRGNIIDIYFDSHEDAWNFGAKRTSDVYWY